MKTVAIIQARMDSERLPGKVLEKIGDKTVLGWVVYRTRMIRRLDEIVVATTDRDVDFPIEQECRWLDVECFQGEADDVLDRYYRAAQKYEASHILRVTADCPMLNPSLNREILDKLIENRYLSYVGCKGWPDGIGQEAFTFSALEWTWRDATEPSDREHVIPYMIRCLDCDYVHRVRSKFSVDTAEDLEYLRGLHATWYGDVPAC